jgi:hypothetical protein
MAYPDLRKCINLLQQSTQGGRLTAPQLEDTGGKDWLVEMATMFRDGKGNEARKFVVANAGPDDYEDIYRFLYKNLDMFGKDDATQNEALLIIRKSLVHHGVIADPEINLAATIVELSNIGK